MIMWGGNVFAYGIKLIFRNFGFAKCVANVPQIIMGTHHHSPIRSSFFSCSATGTLTVFGQRQRRGRQRRR